MSRTIAVAVLLGVLSSAAIAAVPQRQLVAPNLNPALRTVPSIPHTYDAGDLGACARGLAARVDSGTVISGPDGRVVHVTGMADSGASAAEIAITSVSADGRTASGDLLVCTSATLVSPAPVAAAMPLTSAGFESISIRAQSNVIILKTR